MSLAVRPFIMWCIEKKTEKRGIVDKNQYPIRKIANFVIEFRDKLCQKYLWSCRRVRESETSIL